MNPPPKTRRAKLTKTVVDAAQPEADRYTIWDTEIRGLGLLVLPTGTKSFILKYRSATGAIQRTLTLGQYGDITPAQARDKASEMREQIRAGHDPVAEKQAARNAMTVAELLQAFTETEHFAQLAPGSQANDRTRIKRHLVPTLGRIPVAALTGRDIEKAMRDIREGKTALRERTGKPRGLAKVYGGPTAAFNSVGLLRAVYAWAIKQKLAKENPTAGIKLAASRSRDLILDADGYQRMFAAIARLEAAGRIRPAACAAICVIAFTGARKNEIAALRWRHVDLKTGQIVLPPSAHKSGKRTGRHRIIGLPAATRVLISQQPAGEPDDLVFRPARGNRAINLTNPWTIIRAEAGLPSGVVIHSLRHSVASHAAMGGMSTVEMMTSLGHASTQHLVRYVHYAETARAQLAERAASVAITAMAAAAGTPSAEIHPLPRKGA